MATSRVRTSPSPVELPAPTGATEWGDAPSIGSTAAGSSPTRDCGGARRVPAVIWYPDRSAHPRRTDRAVPSSALVAPRRGLGRRGEAGRHAFRRARAGGIGAGALPGVAVLPRGMGAVLLRRHARRAGEPRVHRRRARPRPRDDPAHGLHRRPAPLVPQGRGRRSAHRLEASARPGRPRASARSSTPRPTTSGSRSISSLASTTTPAFSADGSIKTASARSDTPSVARLRRSCVGSTLASRPAPTWTAGCGGSPTAPRSTDRAC